MFTELLPLLNHRPLTITVAPLSGGRIKVCVIPQAVESDERVNDKAGSHKEIKKIPDSAIKALRTPLCLEGTAAELDSGMPDQLAKYTEAHVALHDGLQRAMNEIAEGAQAIADRNKAKSATKQSPSAKQGSIFEGTETACGKRKANGSAARLVRPAEHQCYAHRGFSG